MSEKHNKPIHNIYKGCASKGEIEITSSPVVFENKYIKIFNDEVIFPSSHIGTYIRIQWPVPYSVGIVAITAKDELVTIKSFRHGVREWCQEIPKGFGSEKQNATEIAKRELLEESGYISSECIEVGSLFQSPAIIQNDYRVVLAIGCEKKGEVKHEVTEAISDSIQLVSLKNIEATIENGQIRDSLTISAIFVALSHYRKNKKWIP